MATKNTAALKTETNTTLISGTPQGIKSNKHRELTTNMLDSAYNRLDDDLETPIAAAQAAADAAQVTADSKTDSIANADDVDNAAKAAGKILEVDADGLTHIYVDKPSGGGGGSETFDGLTDTNITTVSTDDVVAWDGTDWTNRTQIPVAAVPTATNTAISDAQTDATQGINDAATADGKAVAAQADATQALADAATAQSTADAAQPESEKGAANGYAPLDASSDVPKANLPTDTVYQAGLDAVETKADDAQSTADAAIPTATKNAASGVAGLDSDTRLAASQLAPKTSTGTAVAFDTDRVYGEPTALTGALTKNTTGAVLGAVAYVHHNSGTDPDLAAAGFTVIGGEYVVSVPNYIYFNFVGATKVLATISQAV